MVVVNLKEFGSPRFAALLRELAVYSADKNRHWFPELVLTYESYLDWFFVMDGDELVGFSTIQKYGASCFRLLTRCYVFPKFRRPVLPKNDHFLSPGSLMVTSQLQWLQHFETVFISLEHIRRKNSIFHMARKMENNTGLKWTVLDGMFLTCGDKKNPSCWQNICYSGKAPDLERITYVEWKNIYERNSMHASKHKTAQG